MSIKCNSSNQKISYGTPSAVQGLSKKSICFWIKDAGVAGVSNTASLAELVGTGTNENWTIALNSDNRIDITFRWSTTTGVWHVSGLSFSSGVFFAVIEYDNGSTANNPVVYFDGVSKTVTRDTAPVGTYSSGTTNTFNVGQVNGSSGYSYIVEDLRVYNRLLSAGEVLTLYASGSPTNIEANDNGLVFNDLLMYATGITGLPFSGTMINTNIFYDRMAGKTGTPNVAGPIAVADFVYGTSF